MKKKPLKLRKEVEETLEPGELMGVTIAMALQLVRVIGIFALIPTFLISLVGYFIWGNDWLTFTTIGLGALLAWSLFRVKRCKRKLRKKIEELNEREV